MKRFKTLLLITVMSISAQAQLSSAVWLNTIANSQAQYVRAMEVDHEGNTYVSGRFFGAIEVKSSYINQTLTSKGNSDIYLIKYNRNGEAVWAKSFGGNDIDDASAMTVDQNGNIYSTGTFSGKVDFDPGNGIQEHTSRGATDIYIVKWNSKGELMWSYAVGSTSSDNATGIAIDQKGDIVCSGHFFKTVRFNTESSDLDIPSNGGLDFYILKLSTDGSFKWAKSIGGENHDSGGGIAIDQNNHIYVGGTFLGPVDFDPSSNEAFIYNDGIYNDAFIARYDSLGNYKWVYPIERGTNKTVSDVAIGPNQQVYATGYFNNIVDFDNGPNVAKCTSVLREDVFVLSLDTAANFRWVNVFGSDKYDVGYNIFVDTLSNIYVAGAFGGEIKSKDSIAETLTHFGSADIFFGVMNDSGDYVGMQSFGGDGYDVGIAMIPSRWGDVSVTGYFSNTADFKVEEITSLGQTDVFVGQLKPCVLLSDTVWVDVWSCDTFVLPHSQQEVFTAGMYFDTLQNQFSCDSIIIYDVIFSGDTLEIISVDDTLWAPKGAAFYQWFKCDSIGNVYLFDSTVWLVPSTDDYYGVILSDSNCSDTLNCIKRTKLSIHDTANNGVHIWPNPVSGNLYFSINKRLINVSLFDLHGKEQPVEIQDHFADVSNVTPGVYFIQFEVDGVVVRKKVVVK